ncbi:sulfate/molybdate ABC transporter ATP-binding protein [Sphingomonas silueang]|uniref:sulfate/molybdate ABC transporter ATP-binding protein n=1 Tax=Sphingomonas silueang TaxID=3156617 RepID=UPI0032B3C18E
MIRISGVTKRFGDYPALHGIDADIAAGEFIALLGPSGSGKTTLLRIIAGLEPQDGGTIEIDGRDVANDGVAERGIGFVFQHYALFRHMSVARNIAFGLDVRRRRNGLSRRDIAARVDELLRFVRLPGLGDRYPGQLSGGQRQRVALARALAVRPKLLLLDEPFGALDAQVRKDLRRWLRDLHREMGLTSIFVTHDQEEALELADRVFVMDRGRLVQAGTPEQVYMEPATAFVSGFVGETNQLADGRHVRPHDIAIVAEGGDPVRVVNLFRKGGAWRIEATDGIGVVEIDLDGDRSPPAIGDQIRIEPVRARYFATDA